jgi:type IV secretory pathway TrbF-like protein
LGGVAVFLSVALTAVSVAFAYEVMRDEREFVTIRENSAGEILGAALATGRLEPKQAVEEWLIGRWIDQVRGVPLDPVAFNRGYFEAQKFMCGTVQGRIDATMKEDPDQPAKLTPAKMIEQGISRRVHVRNITWRGGHSTVAGSANATADLELKYFEPQDPVANPYGMYVCTFDWDASPT